ncbi:hypothetical protein C8N40_102326 [Pontibacter mucosus]|uniref:Uncharacterized protein n=1 Tax=Pontibacter mucosus TaxID=1649266 RepID=A0A2T5YPW1_9BACT|nr:hypothetical protein [Pontibacter mucosus]PTX21350.1 hypothetical protein C8N40_102326 [Pontibacter mucosus]
MKYILLFAFAFLIHTSVSAQSNITLSREAEAYCTNLTRSMANELRLNELGYIKLKELNRERIAATQEILKNHRNDTHLAEQLLEKLAQEYDEKVTAFLNPNQLQAYANYKSQPTQQQQTRFVAVSYED